jgi:hypothetical protein
VLVGLVVLVGLLSVGAFGAGFGFFIHC